MTCAECRVEYVPDYYEAVCNACGDELNRQHERMNDFDDGELTLAQIAARAAGSVVGPVRRRWRVG